MKKNVYVLAAAVWMAAASVTACGQSTASAEQKTSQETQMQETQMQETQAQEMQGEIVIQSELEEGEETEAAEEQAQVSGNGYEDNFAVDGAASAAFGARIKEAVAAKDIEALADLASYPLYMGFADGGVSIESREDFIALGTDRVFTAEMVDAMAAADENGLNPSMAGFALTKDGKPNITFGVTDGELTVKGMNY